MALRIPARRRPHRLVRLRTERETIESKRERSHASHSVTTQVVPHGRDHLRPRPDRTRSAEIGTKPAETGTQPH